VAHRPNHLDDVAGSIETLGRMVGNLVLAIMIIAVGMIVLASVSYILRDIREQQYWKRQRDKALRKSEPEGTKQNPPGPARSANKLGA
jgi:hypothetical protein